jgi:tripartite-type tricarboxylate transporter receptor subunit TctC
VACQPRTGAGPGQSSSGQAAPGGSTPAYNEQAVAAFYQGKTIRIIVGFAPGGGFDVYSRTVARHLGKHIPGNPSVIVDNMTGGGSLTAANHVYAAARPDGLTIGNWIGTLILAQLLGQEGVEFDARRFKYLGVPTPDSSVCAARKESGVTKLSQLVNGPQPLIFGGVAPGTPNDDIPKILGAALSINYRLVSGYSGTSTIRAAADGGEVQAGCWAWESMKATWTAALESGDAVVITQIAPEKIKDLPDVEWAPDLARTDEAKQLLRYGIMIPGAITRPYTVHPETPADRVLALQKAFEATLKDPEFLDEAQKAKLDVVPLPGPEVEKLVQELFAMPEPIKARLKQILVTS